MPQHHAASEVTVALVSSSEDGAWGPLRGIDRLLDDM